MDSSTILKVKATEKMDVGNFLYFVKGERKVAWGWVQLRT